MTLRQTIRDLDFETDFESPEWRDLAIAICKYAGIGTGDIRRAPSSDHVVFLVGSRFLLKIFRPWRNCFERERKALEFVSKQLDVETPEIVSAGDFEGVDFLVTTQVSGIPFSRPDFLRLPRIDQAAICADLANCLRQIHELDPSPFADDWAEFIRDRSSTFVGRQAAHGVNAEIVDDLPAYIDQHFASVPTSPTVFLHGDLHFGNLRFHRVNERLRVSGLFDFADSRRGFHEYDFLAVGVLMLQGERELQRQFFREYGYPDANLNDSMRSRLMMLTMLYETSDLRRYAQRLSPEAVHLGLADLESAIWSFSNDR